MKKICVLLWILAAGPAYAQNFEAGQNGWQLERLPGDFVVLRTDIGIPARGNGSSRQGLLILTCERNVRRIRFQIGDTPRSPSIQASSDGRAIVRAWLGDKALSPQIYPTVRFFDDGSFEFRETANFNDSVMRGILNLFRKAPTSLEVILFKGTETRAFQSGTAMQFKLHDLDSNLGSIYGFEGLCFRASP